MEEAQQRRKYVNAKQRPWMSLGWVDLAAEEVVPLGPPLAVPAKRGVEGRAHHIAQDGAQVKLWGTHLSGWHMSLGKSPFLLINQK